ncbi:MAG: hypothetical protein EA369_04715 [Bradymonadales bacterium]|nr:MAG: hypothetical protein EA369_04715 [Bradymonadales bacterium]
MVSESRENISSQIVLGDLQGFFEELLVGTAEKQDQSVSPMALNYVAKLLTHFHQVDNFFKADSGRLPVLADILAEAMAADSARRVSILRRLGDTSLMMSGYFREALNRRGMKQSYYAQMGESAYSHLSDLSETKNVFIELADGFQVVADLLAVISESLRIQEYNALELLKFYSSSKSDFAREKLKEQGIIPMIPKE